MQTSYSVHSSPVSSPVSISVSISVLFGWLSRHTPRAWFMVMNFSVGYSGIPQGLPSRSNRKRNSHTLGLTFCLLCVSGTHKAPVSHSVLALFSSSSSCSSSSGCCRYGCFVVLDTSLTDFPCTLLSYPNPSDPFIAANLWDTIKRIRRSDSF